MLEKRFFAFRNCFDRLLIQSKIVAQKGQLLIK
jgi:hypothetical protein